MYTKLPTMPLKTHYRYHPFWGCSQGYSWPKKERSLDADIGEIGGSPFVMKIREYNSLVDAEMVP